MESQARVPEGCSTRAAAPLPISEASPKVVAQLSSFSPVLINHPFTEHIRKDGEYKMTALLSSKIMGR